MLTVLNTLAVSSIEGAAPRVRGEEGVNGRVTTPALRAPEPNALPAVGGSWVFQGPSPILNGQTEGLPNAHVSGAVHAIVAHPSNANILWIGAANGGVWKTTNALNASPAWTASGDAFSSTSIGALALDPTDGSANTLVAGFGRFSSFGGVGGPRSGLLRTTNGGTNWTALTPAMLSGKNITGLAPRGTVIVVAVNIADDFECSNIGVFRSVDTGATFTQVSGAGGSGLPSGRAFDLASDPANSAILYTAIRDSSACGGTNGVYKSVDTGATWSKVSNAAIDALLADSPADPQAARIAVGLSNQVYVGIINNLGRLSGLFRSGAGGSSWTQLDSPSTNEGGTFYGVHPSSKPGSQGGLHFSIAADPTNANIVYVGGDRQPGPGDPGATFFPNSLGASNYTGRLFRVNAAAGAGTQATPLTHCAVATAACNSTISTTSNSAPHADSRRIVFDAAGNLLEADDGGIFRRTNPRTTGDWFSVNGNLAITEIHDLAYDSLSNTIFSGNQDNGSTEQTVANGTSWTLISSGDGGDVAVDDFTSGTQSVRYTSFQNLGSFRRRIMNAAGAPTSSVFPALTVVGGGPEPLGQFVTPVGVNAIAGTRLLIAGANELYESLDRGDTITALGFLRRATSVVYGGKSGGIDNVNLIYAIAATSDTTNALFVRTSGTGAPVQTATSPGTTSLRDVAVNPSDWNNAFVANAAGEVWTTVNAGGLWTNITGNLPGGTTDVRTIQFVPGSPNAIVVGGLNGVFRMPTNDAGVWKRFGFGMSSALVFDLDYDATDDTLVAGTMGRGAWKLNPVTTFAPVPSLSIGDVSVNEGNAGTTNAVFTVSLSAPSGVPVSVDYTTSNGTAASGLGTFSNSSPITTNSVGTFSFSNSSPITINAVGSATPYPASVSASGLSGTVTKVTATITGFSHTWARDVDILLVGPQGQSVVLMSDAGGASNLSNRTLTFDDTASGSVPANFSSGTYLPTNVADFQGGDVYPVPAPASGYGSSLSVFNGTSANGTWNLFVVDDSSGDAGSIASGFSLTISTNISDYVASSGTVLFDPGETSQPVAIVVNGDTAVEQNEIFFVNLNTPSNATILDGQGQATITDDDGASLPAPTNLLATATDATTVNVTWTASVGASSYRVYRSTGAAFILVGSPVTTVFNDAGVVANTAYRYKVRAFAGTESADSNVDVATTVVFTDPTLSTGTTVQLPHFNELLLAVNALRTLAVLPPITFTSPTPSGGVTVRRQHLLDLRAGLDGARTALSLGALSYTDASIVSGITLIKGVHVAELRQGVK